MTTNEQHAEQIYRFLVENPGASRRDIMTATALGETSYDAARKQLTNAGRITKTGSKRGTRWHAVTAASD